MRRLLFLITFFVLVFAIWRVVLSIVDLWQKQDVLRLHKEKLAALQKERLELEKQAEKVRDPLFIEREVRDKLFLGKEDEQVLLLPTNTASNGKAEDKKKNIPIYQQWLMLFIQGNTTK